MNPEPLSYIDGETLLTTALPPIRFVVAGLLSQGLHILAGAPKAGKSWLALWLCLRVAAGEPIWDLPTARGGALYLCLEDSYSRIQNRLLDITDEAPASLFFATMSAKLRSGLEEQIEGFLDEHPDTRLVVIDTLQRVRITVNDGNPYANDYRDLSVLKSLADRRGIAILLIHHLRKMNDDDPMNMISGTTGISGAADSNFVLRKDRRGGRIATLYCTGRDIEYRELTLKFDPETHVWDLTADSVTAGPEPPDRVIFSLSAFLNEHGPFSGTATELADALGEAVQPNVLMKKLLRNRQELADRGIELETRRTHERKELRLRRVDCVGSVGKTDTGSVSNLSTQPSQPLQAG